MGQTEADGSGKEVEDPNLPDTKEVKYPNFVV